MLRKNKTHGKEKSWKVSKLPLNVGFQDWTQTERFEQKTLFKIVFRLWLNGF